MSRGKDTWRAKPSLRLLVRYIRAVLVSVFASMQLLVRYV